MNVNASSDSPDGDWAAQAANSIEKLVDLARQKVTNPALKLGRAVVFGLIIALVTVVCAPLVAIALVRVLAVATGRAWAADFIIGGLFICVGTFLWSKRSATVTK